uniref:N-acetyllactosaminide beta-1,3-N-acetylglucosaminyltransferase 2 n=1 Tax=Ficedula albicollis TaxID=59894 RepID=U3KIA7_FICAL
MSVGRRRLKLLGILMMVNIFIYVIVEVSKSGSQDKNAKGRVVIPRSKFWRKYTPHKAYWNKQQQKLELLYNPILSLLSNMTVEENLVSNLSALNSCDPDPLVHTEVSDFANLPDRFKDFLLYLRCRNYSLLMDQPNKCEQKPFLLLAIKSLIPHFDRRQAIRESWGKEIKSGDVIVRRVFLLGQTPPEDNFPDLSHMIKFESDTHQDILLWNYRDTFFNLTLKEVLFLKWVSSSCANAQFIFKGDDDVFVNTNQILDYLKSLSKEKAKDLFIGDVIKDAGPHREKKLKYYIPESVYEGSYPPYAGGGGFLYSGDLALRLNNASDQVRGSSQEYWKVKPEPESPWLLAYVPIRNCHRVLKDKYGEFSPPAFHADFPVTFWCNWTIWAGSRRHIIIYIQGFIAKDACNKNEDKILFEGVSSLVENSVVYACWKNEMHVFATFAQAVHVVLLKRYLPNQRDAQFKGKYYIFQDQQGDSSSKDDAISGTSVSKLPKRGGIFQSGWVENLRGTLGFATTRGSTTVLSSEPMQGRGITLDTTAVGRPTELILCERARTQALETKAPCGLGSELLGAQEAQGIGRPEGIIPTAAQDIWGQNPSVSEDSTVSFGPALSALLETPLLGAFQPAEPFLQPTLETPLLGAFQPAEPFLQPTDVSLKSSQPVLSPTLKPKGLGHLQFTIKPTGTSHGDLAALSEPLSPGTGQSQEGTGPSRDSQLSTASLEKDGSCALLSVPADGLAKSLMPSLRSPSDLVTRDHLQLLPERSQSSLGHLSMPKPEPGTTGPQHTKLMDIFPLRSSRGAVRRRTVLHPTAPGQLGTTGSQHTKLMDVFPLRSSRGAVRRRTVPHPTAPGLAVPALATGLEHPLTHVSALGTETNPVLVTSSTAPVPTDSGSLDLIPEAPLPPQVESVSTVASLPAAVDRDPVSLGQRDISPASPGGQEMVSPSPPCHPSVASELGIDGSSRCLSPGMQKLVLGQAGGQGGQTTASVGLMARSPSPIFVTVPGPGVRLTQPEAHVSSGSGVPPASLSDTREEHKVHQDSTASDKPASAYNFRGFKMQGTPEALQVGAGQRSTASFSTIPAHPAAAALWGETLPRDQKIWKPSGVPRNTQMSEGQQRKHAGRCPRTLCLGTSHL